ncbi:MAG: hypothetical protein HRU19_29195 [Pseudobacteriovorax sp.]|nr:hypothetical protein [Pseudobacteriovorax sp.]
MGLQRFLVCFGIILAFVIATRLQSEVYKVAPGPIQRPSQSSESMPKIPSSRNHILNNPLITPNTMTNLSKKPKSPKVPLWRGPPKCNPEDFNPPTLPVYATPKECKLAGGEWRDNWKKGKRHPRGKTHGWQALGRGNYRFRGCTGFPTVDGGKRCQYDQQCSSNCVKLQRSDEFGVCNKKVRLSYPAGRKYRCKNGILQTIMVD